eukprot:gene30697-35724_t
MAAGRSLPASNGQDACVLSFVMPGSPGRTALLVGTACVQDTVGGGRPGGKVAKAVRGVSLCWVAEERGGGRAAHTKATLRMVGQAEDVMQQRGRGRPERSEEQTMARYHGTKNVEEP